MSRYRYYDGIEDMLDDIQDYVEDLHGDLSDLEDENWDLQNRLDELENDPKHDYTDLQHYLFNNHPNGAHVEWDSVLGKWIVDGKVL